MSFKLLQNNAHPNRLIHKYHRCKFGNILFSTTTKLQKTANINAVPEKIVDRNKSVGIWLMTCSGLVFGMVVIGGLTRLTKSGLSMTDWKFHGGFPPLTVSDWRDEFEKYKQYPEYRRINRDMTLNEFKTIYFWEYSHRMFGRLIGLSFTFPLIYYAIRGKYITASLYKRLGVLFGLGASQGLIGWWMVKSGLQHDGNNTYNNLPRVSPYRLATHLGFAFVLYIGLLYNGMWIYSQRNAVQSVLNHLNIEIESILLKYRLSVYGVSTLSIITAFIGAFVAGNEAGLVYNEWPKMGNGYIPSDLYNPYIQPKWRNIFENSSMIQFIHRNLAYATVISSVFLFIYTKRLNKLQLITPNVLYASGSLMTVSLLQSTLGVLTLINHIPISLASMHQTGSLTLLTVIVWLLFVSRKNGYSSSKKLINQIMKTGKPSFLIM